MLNIAEDFLALAININTSEVRCRCRRISSGSKHHPHGALYPSSWCSALGMLTLGSCLRTSYSTGCHSQGRLHELCVHNWSPECILQQLISLIRRVSGHRLCARSKSPQNHNPFLTGVLKKEWRRAWATLEPTYLLVSAVTDRPFSSADRSFPGVVLFGWDRQFLLCASLNVMRSDVVLLVTHLPVTKDFLAFYFDLGITPDFPFYL